ncbi:MAG: hypothetical protein ACK51L_00045, partial [bacterium]
IITDSFCKNQHSVSSCSSLSSSSNIAAEMEAIPSRRRAPDAASNGPSSSIVEGKMIGDTNK